MSDTLDAFIATIPGSTKRRPSELIDYIVYYLTVTEKRDGVTPSDVEACFERAHLHKYSNTAYYLSRNAKRQKSQTPKFMRGKMGYLLERNHQVELQKTLLLSPGTMEASHGLHELLPKIHDAKERAFLQETVACYGIGARRAAIIMMWMLVMHHLQEFIFRHHLPAFNAALAKDSDKRIKVSVVTSVDDFADIPENKLIELARVARVITHDVRKILDTKLGIRNSYAHPSSISISEVKCTDFIVDLTENVLLTHVV